MAVPADHIVPLPDVLGFSEAAPLLCAGLTTYAAFRNAGLRPGQRAVVIGVGGLGHLAISIGAALGAEVYAVTTSPDKAVDAKARGAVFVGSVDEVADRLAHDGGAHVVLNTVDALEPVARIIPGMARQGSIALIGGTGDKLPITPDEFIALQLRVLGTFFGSTQDVRDLFELAVKHNIRPQIESYRFEEVDEVHARLRENKVRYRAVLEF
jgi:D-arabinose 1-dehydrogenase-like Zn-dependent alcohol dehydrogenase